MSYQSQGHRAIDQVLDLAVHYRERHPVNMTMTVLPAVSPLPEGAKYRNRVRIDLKPEADAAAVMITMATDPHHPSSWISKTDIPRPGVHLCWDYWTGPEASFPPDSIITMADLREVVHQFYDRHGESLPTAVAWHRQSESMW